MSTLPADPGVTVRLFVPGRIEVLGKHTDYAGGRSLLAAVGRGFTVEAVATEDRAISITDTGRDQTVVIDLEESDRGPDVDEGIAAPGDDGSGSADPGADTDPGWAVYPRTVVRRVARDFPGVLSGCRIHFSNTLPTAAGLSSSSALITAIFMALDAVLGISRSGEYRAAIPDLEALAGYLGAVERGSPFAALARAAGAAGAAGAEAGVGTRGGSEDHVAILCGRPGVLVRYAFEPVRREGDVPFPDGLTFVIAASGVRAEKTGESRTAYNRLSDEAARAAEIWREATAGDEPHLGAILAAPDGFARLRDAITERAGPDERDALLRRVRHFAAESGTLVPAAADALAGGDLEAFGEMADRSQTQAEKLLGNQVPETVHLARSARELGAVAATAFGAGFGGAVWALVPASDGLLFLDAWRARYLAAFPDRKDAATFFTTHAAPPAHRL